MRAEILVTDAEDNQVVAGSLRLNSEGDGIIVDAFDGYGPMMDEIVTEPVFVDDDPLFVEDDPETWLELLPYRYTGSHMRAQIVTEDADVKDENGNSGQPESQATDADSRQDSEDVRERIAYLMEHRSFGKEPSENGRLVYSRHDGDIKIYITLEDDEVSKVETVFSGGDKGRHEKGDHQVGEGFEEIKRIASAYGD